MSKLIGDRVLAEISELKRSGETPILIELSLPAARSLVFFSCEKPEVVTTKMTINTCIADRNLFHVTIAIAVSPIAELFLGRYNLISLAADAARKLKLKAHQELQPARRLRRYRVPEEG